MAWRKLGMITLPDSIPLFKETRELMTQRNQSFINSGGKGFE